MRWVVHGVTLALWGYLSLLAWSLGQRLIGRPAGGIMAACCLFSGGVPYFCDVKQPFFQYVEGRCFADGLSELPPLPSNFLQHPWSLGLPLGIAALLLFQSRRTRSAGWWIALSALLVLLSFSQVVLFGCLSAGLAVAGGFTSPGKRWKQLLIFALWGLSLLLLARLLHGFFAPTPEPGGLRLDFAPFWREPFKEWAIYLGESLGLLLPMGLAGFFFLERERLALVVTAGMGFAVFCFFRYPNSWDIVKFLMVVQLAAAIAASAAFVAAFRSRWLRWLAVPALAALVSQGVLWLGTAALGKYDGWYKQSIDSPAAPAADERMIAYLRQHIRPGEAVWRRDAPWTYALLGGLPIQHVDGGTSTFGFSRGVWDARQDLVDHPRDSIDDYERQGLRWFVLGPWDGPLRQKMELWVRSGRAEARLKEPPLELFHAK